MSLRVDLIMENEQRSASLVSFKGIVRIVTVVAPLTLLMLIGLWVIGIFRMKGEASMLQSEWNAAVPRQANAKQLRDVLARNEEILDVLKGLTRTRLEWSEQLRGLMEIAPANIRLKTLSIDRHVVLNEKQNQNMVVFGMSLEGTASGSDADTSVATLKMRLMDHPTFIPVIDFVEVKKYGVDTAPDADKDDRIFRIDCRYTGRSFK